MRKQLQLLELQKLVEECRNCGLCESRLNVVFGEGDSNARLMIIGEAPGADEDLKGQPFIGSSGKLLFEILAEQEIYRNQVYTANVLKCRPPENRNPTPEEITACKGYLREQIKIIRPKVIMTLGNFATGMFTGHFSGISSSRGKWVEGTHYSIMPMLHPGALLRSGAHFSRDKSLYQNDIYKVKQKLRHI